MSKPISLLSALLCTFIWGTTFIAQDTGMDNIGPFTFNAVRFFVGFLAITPLVILFELKNFKSELKTDKKTFINYVSLIGLSLFFRFCITTGCFTLYRCCKCSLFYNLLCAYGANHNLSVWKKIDSLECLAFSNFVFNWRIFINKFLRCNC